MRNFFIGIAFFEAGAFFGFFVAALMQAARSGEIGLNGKEDSHGREHLVGAENCTGTVSSAGRDTLYCREWMQFLILLVAEFGCFLLITAGTVIVEVVEWFSGWIAEL